MIEFQPHPDCTKCSLHESARNVGIPTREFDVGLATQHRALLIVGQNPGTNEDKSTQANPNGKSWIGYTGQLLSKFVAISGLGALCDVYVANACRCRHPQGGDISQAQVRACRGHLEYDIQLLLIHYKEVIIFAVGAKGAYSVTNNSSLKDTFKKQGRVSEIFPWDVSGPISDPTKIRVFSTFHLAMLHPLRKPALVRAVEAHFVLLRRYLEGKFIPNEEIEEPELGVPLLPWLLSGSGVVSCDIETYGILEGVEQTVFNPIKSKYIDGVDFCDQVVCVNFSFLSIYLKCCRAGGGSVVAGSAGEDTSL